MKKTELIQLMKLISKYYQNFEVDKEKIEAWFVLMQDVPFERAQKNLWEHCRRSSFVPTPADIIRHDPEQYTDYDRLKAETAALFAEMDEWERKAIPCPEHLRPKFLKGGGST